MSTTMRLIHYDKEIVTFDPNRIYPDTDRDAYFKPKGLWVSDESDFGWSKWCEAESFATDHLIYEHQVELHKDHNILIISTVPELDRFHEEYSIDIVNKKAPQYRYPERRDWLDWRHVYPLWQGIIVTPYLWERRLKYMWYYGWDCASGSIWDLSAIRSFTPLLKQLK